MEPNTRITYNIEPLIRKCGIAYVSNIKQLYSEKFDLIIFFFVEILRVHIE